MNPTFTLWATPALKRMALAFLFFTAVMAAQAAIRTATTSGSWNNTTTWGGTVPVNGDDVVINPGITVTVTANATVNSISFANTAATVGILNVNSGVVLTITTSITLRNAANANTAASLTGAGTISCASIVIGGTTTPSGTGNFTASATLTSSITTLTTTGGLQINGTQGGAAKNPINGVFNLVSGTATIGSTIAFSQSANSTATVSLATGAQAGTLNLSSSTPFSGTGTTTFNGTSATVNYTGANQTVRNTAYQNLGVGGSGTKTPAADLSIAGNLTVSGTSILDLGTFTANTTGATKTLQVDNGAVLRMGGTNTLPSGYATYTLGSTSTVEYYGTDQVVGAATYGNLLLNGTGTKSTTANINVNGTMTVGNGVVFTPASSNTVSGSGQLAGTGTIQVTLVGAGTDLVTQYPIVLSNTPALQNLTVDYAGAGTQTVNAYTYGNVIVSGSGTKTASGSFYSNNNLTVTGTATLDLLDWNADNTALAPTTNGMISVSDGATLRVGGNHKLPQNYTTYIFTSASTVEYYGGGTHAIVERTYGNLKITDNSTVVTTSGALTINGNLTIGSGATFNATNSSLNLLTHIIKGTWTNNGTFNASTTTIDFNGSTAQSINGANTTTFYNLSVDNSNGLTINKTAMVDANGVLTFGAGIITTSTASLLILNDNASITGVSNSSHVNGPIRKVGNDAFTFPVGKNGKYVPISISAPSDINDAFTAEYFPQSGSALGPISSSAQGRGLEAVSQCEYWVLDRTVGTSTVDVTLTWGPDNACYGPGYITNPFFLVVAHYADPDKAAPYIGGEWDDFSEGTDNVITGTATGGSVTWKNVSTFSPFTIGSTDASQAALPVTFVSFTGKKVESGNQLTWKVAGETNVKQYEIERSTANNNGFVKIGSVHATGNDNYSFMDGASPSGTVYYRIKNVDYNGKFKYSTVLSLKNGMGAVVFKVVPTIAVSRVTVQHNVTTGTAFISVSTIDGKVVRNIRLAAGSMQTEVDMSSLQHGLYILKYSDGNGHVEVAKVVKQ